MLSTYKTNNAKERANVVSTNCLHAAFTINKRLRLCVKTTAEEGVASFVASRRLGDTTASRASSRSSKHHVLSQAALRIPCHGTLCSRLVGVAEITKHKERLDTRIVCIQYRIPNERDKDSSSSTLFAVCHLFRNPSSSVA